MCMYCDPNESVMFNYFSTDGDELFAWVGEHSIVIMNEDETESGGFDCKHCPFCGELLHDYREKGQS